IGCHPDVAVAIFVNVADAVVRQTVGDGEERSRSAGDAIQTVRRAEPARAVAALLHRQNAHRAAVAFLHPGVAVPAMQTVRRADPPHAVAVFEDGPDKVVFESMTPVPADERAGVQLFEAAVGADPEIAFVVFGNRAHGGIEQAVVDSVRGHAAAAPAEEAMTVGADPEIAVAVAMQRRDLIGGKSPNALDAVALDAAARDALESRRRADEEGVRAVGNERDDAVAGEAFDALGGAGAAAMPAQSRRRA